MVNHLRIIQVPAAGKRAGRYRVTALKDINMNENTSAGASETEEREYVTKPKIARVDAKGKVLDFQDFIENQIDRKGNLEEGKITLNYTEYDVSTHKANQTLKHYIDVDVARVLFDDILNRRFSKDPGDAEGKRYLPLLDEFKGGRGSAAKHPEWEWASRRLIVTFDPAMRVGPSVIFSFIQGEGEQTSTGAIKPKYTEAPIKAQILVSLPKARVVAACILDYIRCIQAVISTKSMIEDTIPQVVEDAVNRSIQLSRRKAAS
ncbi:MAG: hypothetical protein ACYC0V_01565 [Armatimonadota bacterium]